MLLLQSCDLSQDELARLDDANEKINLGADELSGILAAKNDPNVDHFITLAASNGGRFLEFSDIYRHREDGWVQQIVGEGNVEDNAAAALARMKTALAAALIARDFPKLAPVAMDVVEPLLSVPEYGLDCLDKRFLEAAAATLRLIRFRDDCAREKSRNDVLEFVGGVLDVTIADILAGHIIVTIKEQLEPTAECPEGNKGEYIPGKDGAKDQIVVQRSVFASADEGTVTLAHEAVHASYDHDGDNRRAMTLELVPSLNQTMEQAIASATTLAAFTLLYGDDFLEQRRARRDQACSEYETDNAEWAAKLAGYRTTSRKRPLIYIHHYVVDKLAHGEQALAKKDPEVHGAELIITRGGFFNETVLPELLQNAAMDAAAKRTIALYAQVVELENQILTEAESACTCGLDPKDDPLLKEIYPPGRAVQDPATGEPVTYVNHDAFFTLARKRAKAQENGDAITWWLARHAAAVAKLRQGNVSGANAVLDQAITTMVAAETQRLMGIEPGE